MINVPARPSVGRAMDKSIGIRQVGFNEAGSQLGSGVRLKIQRCLKSNFLTCTRVPEKQFGGVEVNAWSGRATIERVAENRKAEVCGVDADLMGATGYRSGLEEGVNRIVEARRAKVKE